MVSLCPIITTGSSSVRSVFRAEGSYLIPPSLPLEDSGGWDTPGTFQQWMKMQQALLIRKDNPDPKYQISQVMALLMSWKEQVRSVQNTNLQTILSGLWGDILWGFFFFLLLKRMKQECLGSCDCSEAQWFTSGCACLCSCAHEQGACATKGLSSSTVSQGYLWPTCKEKIHIYLFTCTCTNIQ